MNKYFQKSIFSTYASAPNLLRTDTTHMMLQ